MMGKNDLNFWRKKDDYEIISFLWELMLDSELKGVINYNQTITNNCFPTEYHLQLLDDSQIVYERNKSRKDLINILKGVK